MPGRFSMTTLRGNEKRVFILSPTESELTMRGKRHPNLASHLSRQGWDVHYISSTFSHAEKRLFSEHECEAAQNRLPYRLTLIHNGLYRNNLSVERVSWNRRFARKASDLLKQELRNTDILIVPSRPPELICAAAKLKIHTGCRTLLDIRDIWPDALSQSNGLVRKAFDIYCNCYLRRSVADYDAYVHVAPSFLPWLARYAPTAESTFIPLGIDEKRWGVPPPGGRAATKWPS